MKTQTFLLLLIVAFITSVSNVPHAFSAGQPQLEKQIKSFFCLHGSSIVHHLSTADEVFEIVIKYSNQIRVMKNMDCTFFGDFHGANYLVQILDAGVVPYKSTLEILDGTSRLMLKEFNPHWSRQLFVSESDTVRVIFKTQDDYPEDINSIGYRIRLTRFTGCPPDWYHLGEYCFTSSSASFLGSIRGIEMPHSEADYETAQAVCNRMRANLLVASESVLRQSGIGDLGQLMRNLSISDPTWIGILLTDWRNPASLIWLDGTSALIPDNKISCQSDPSLTITRCKRAERFAYWTPKMVFLDQSIIERQFACFLSVKSLSSSSTEVYYPSIEDSPHAFCHWTVIISVIIGTVVSNAISITITLLIRCWLKRDPAGPNMENPAPNATSTNDLNYRNANENHSTAAENAISDFPDHQAHQRNLDNDQRPNDTNCDKFNERNNAFMLSRTDNS